MEYVSLGSSGLTVSRVALGCMGFGAPGFGRTWELTPEQTAGIFRQAVELGITFWDTANAYGHGTSEEVVGRAIREYTSREEVVLATKVFAPMHDGPGGGGLSRRAILEQVDASLRRLDVDFVDVLHIHRFDPEVPVEETLEALDGLVLAGKVRFLAASSMWAWQFSKLQYTAAANGWNRFVAMQDKYSLLHREEEREMFHLLADQGVVSVPYGTLAEGRLSRPWVEGSGSDGDRAIVDAVERVARERAVSMTEVALAWVLRNPHVGPAIVGASRPAQLPDAVAALELVLTDDEVRALESPYEPRLPVW